MFAEIESRWCLPGAKRKEQRYSELMDRELLVGKMEDF